ncbi:MAG TPA: hypothetical protein VK163_02845 [Opitutaceae bacterium]|nr:hypothetical protein [Opitutaceae bacterium]
MLLSLALAAHLVCALRGWEIPGLLGHGFRQAQTALSIDAMRQDGFRLDYATPVLGKPWAIPMEFPLYQWLVVRVGAATGWPTAQAGRAVSLAGFYVGLGGVWLALRALGAGRLRACLALVPLLATPVYLFYSRAVLIESLAWAGSTWFLGAALQWWRNPARGWLALAWLSGALAALVKGTTWAVFLPALAVALLWSAWRSPRAEWLRTLATAAGRGLLLAGPPLALGLAWVAFADAVKAENPLAAFLVSGNLAAFNFGSWAERFDPAFWRALAYHWSHAVLPWWAAVIGGAALVATTPRWRGPAAAALACFFGGPLVFSNLYRIHDYYHYATAGFAVVAVALALLGVAERGGWWRWVGMAGLAVVVSGQAVAYRNGYYGVQTQPFFGTGPLATQIRELTQPSDVIVVHGTDWSSELPYYAQRRALVVPDGQLATAPEAVEANIRRLGDEHVALVVFAGPAMARRELIERRIRDFALWPEPLFRLADAVVYVAESDIVRMAAILQSDGAAPGVERVSAGPKIEGSPEIRPLGARRFAGAFVGFKPTPERGVLPYGYFLCHEGDRRHFMAHVPTELHFPVSTDNREVVLAYRIFGEAFAKPNFSGVRFVVELRGPQGVTTLLDDWIDVATPAEERGVRERLLPLPAGASGEVVFRTLPGEDGNASYGWALLERFELR